MTDVLVDHGSSRPGRWLRARRVRIALWTAVAEAIIVAIFHGVSRWTVIVLAIVAVGIYVAAGRSSRSDTARQASWIFAASQVLAALAGVLAFFFLWLAIVVAVVVGIVALFFLFTDRK